MAPIPGDFSEIANVLNTKPVALESVLCCDGVRAAFKGQYSPLVSLFTTEVVPLARIALGLSPDSPPAAIASAFYCLTNFVPIFSNQLGTNRQFVTVLLSVFQLPGSISDYNLLAFSRIFQFLVQASQGFVFMSIPDKVGLMTNLIKYLGNLPVFELITELTSKNSQPVRQFLEAVDISNRLLQSLSDDELSNCQLLKLLTSLVSSTLLSEILVRPLLDLDHIGKLFDYALNSKDNILSAQASRLLIDICIRDLSGKLKGSQTSVVQFLVGKIPQMCERILIGKYTQSNSQLLALVVRLCELTLDAGIPTCVRGLVKSMFNLMFVNIGHTILHNDFIALIKFVGLTAELIEECGFTERIPAAFGDWKENLAVYWGTLWVLAKLIKGSQVPMPKTGPWKDFVGGFYLEIEGVLKGEYGGPLPPGTEAEVESSDSDEYEYQYEEDVEESSGEDP
jgi:hypothetical protein